MQGSGGRQVACPSEELRLTRRTLLRVSALAGGGLALGVLLPLHADPASPGLAPEPELDQTNRSGTDPASRFVPNAWIRIPADGLIQLVLARSEMGQGVMTALPMLLAEELDVGLDQVELEPAQVDPAYVNRLLGEQATGGSTSVRDAWTGLREAGAIARALLISAAAAAWGVPESECRSRRGRVHHVAGEPSLSYAELASAAARLPVPERVALKSPADWTLIGTPQPRLDTPAKVTGKAGFGLDVRLSGMLYASVERCPVLGSRVRSWRASATREIPSVIDVLAVRSGIAVVAETSWGAIRGRERLKVECRPSSKAAVETGRLGTRLRIGLTGRAAVAHQQGDVSAALEGATNQIEAVYEVPFQAHACMEPMNCTADVGPDHCGVYVPTQSQGGVLELARRITGLPAERISVHTTLLGGGFERRREQDFVYDAVELSMRFGRPVQVIWTREDDLRHDYYRPMTLHRLRAGIDQRGDPTAWFHRIVGPSVLARVRPEGIRDGIDPVLVEGAANLPYAIPNMRVEYRRADTPVPVGLWNGGGYTQNTYVTECFLDEVARAAGVEPLGLRRILLAASPRHLRLLDLVAAQSGWGGPAVAGHAQGIATLEAFGSLIAAVAEVSSTGGRVQVHRVVCALDCGQVINPDTVRAQIESGIVFGLTGVLKGSITFAEGRVEQRGFGDYPLLRFDEMPAVEVHILPSDAEPGGVGGLGTPVIAPAVANAVFALTGRAVRTLPIRLE